MISRHFCTYFRIPAKLSSHEINSVRRLLNEEIKMDWTACVTMLLFSSLSGGDAGCSEISRSSARGKKIIIIMID